jgi:hypothetical protein
VDLDELGICGVDAKVLLGRMPCGMGMLIDDGMVRMTNFLSLLFLPYSLFFSVSSPC